MRARTTYSLVTLALLAGAWSCAHTTARTDESAGAAPNEKPTATASDTAVQNPPGYRGMERDTTMVPPGAASAPVDTFLQRQGTTAPQDTMGYSGLERDTTGLGKARAQATDSLGGRTVPGMANDSSNTSGMSTDSTMRSDSSGYR